jgi:hypothetical protein
LKFIITALLSSSADITANFPPPQILFDLPSLALLLLLLHMMRLSAAGFER